MRLVFASDHTYLPHRVGGRESSIHEMASLYQSRGHEVTVLALRPSDRMSRLQRLLSRAIWGPRWNPPYRVLHSRNVVAAMGFMLENELADAYIINFEEAERYAQTSLARSMRNQVIYLRDVQGVGQATPETFPRDALLVANSHYTARAYSARTGREPLVIPPQISLERYASPTSGEFVTFINPVPKKGVEITLNIAAALPDIPFLFVEGWPICRSTKVALRRRTARLGNVRFWSSVLDMRRVYSRTRVLLVPSLWEEAFGRVVVEAQASGIPSVASDRGGIREAVGDAGILLRADDPVSTWADAVRRVWTDSSLRASLSDGARTMAVRHYRAAVSGAIRLLTLLAREGAQPVGHIVAP
jgi:glycosyltransferase involved in cell wall biosynthesis